VKGGQRAGEVQVELESTLGVGVELPSSREAGLGINEGRPEKFDPYRRREYDGASSGE